MIASVMENSIERESEGASDKEGPGDDFSVIENLNLEKLIIDML